MKPELIRSLLLSSIFLLCLMFSACQKRKATVTFEKVLTASLEHILSSEDLAGAYYIQPLKIIRPEKFPINSRIVVAKKECILLPTSTDPREVMQGMDIFKPIPLIRIFNYKRLEDKTSIEISFPASGPVYKIEMDGDDEVGYKVKEMTIYVT